MEKFKVGDKVRMRMDSWLIGGHRRGIERPILTVTRVDEAGIVHYNGSIFTGEDGGQTDNGVFGHSLELVTPAQPVPIGANPPEAKKVFDVEDKAPAPKRESILDEAVRVTSGDRRRDYGSAKVNHDRIALFWNVWDIVRSASEGGIALALEKIVEVRRSHAGDLGDSARDVAMKMILLKIAREANTPKHDNLVDICGYARCLQEINDL